MQFAYVNVRMQKIKFQTLLDIFNEFTSLYNQEILVLLI